MRPYTRSLHPDDYAFLSAHAGLVAFQREMVERNVPHREWHPHRFWEYASIMQQLSDLKVSSSAQIVDLGAGASFFDPFLALLYPNLCCTDNLKYGEVESMVQAQREAYGVRLPNFNISMEDMHQDLEQGWGEARDFFDVTMCISTIEHVDDHDAAFREMVRITKPGGYIFITSDYFRDREHYEQSVSKHLQVTPYTKEYVLSLPARFGVQFVGEHDLDYRGDFVHNYSFCNICLRKRSPVSTGALVTPDNGKG